jgi:hypothetical protein
MAAGIREADAQNWTLERRGSATPMKRRCNVDEAPMQQRRMTRRLNNQSCTPLCFLNAARMRRSSAL